MGKGVSVESNHTTVRKLGSPKSFILFGEGETKNGQKKGGKVRKKEQT